MRRKAWLVKSMVTAALAVSLVCSHPAFCQAEPSQGEDGTASREVVEVSSPEELVKLAAQCRYDNWAAGKYIKLTKDIDLNGVEFSGIPYFSGILDGDGHTVSNVSLHDKSSNYGFFRYISASAVVKNLHVSGSVAPGGSQETVGGLAGNNYGILQNCSFTGTVTGKNTVGGIAGSNKASGRIIGCSSDAGILATNSTGGIAGENEGLIVESVSKSSVNTEELKTTLDLGGVDIGTLNLAKNVITRNDMGGIAGTSTGTIKGCINQGKVGFRHLGYNVGGIAGSQRGTILGCSNEGEVFGRKDVGGIVGQAEPYVESEYLQDKVQETREDISQLSGTLSQISSSLEQTSGEAKQYADSLSAQYSNAYAQVVENLNQVSGSLEEKYPDAQKEMDTIKSAMDNINSIQTGGEPMTEEQADSIKSSLNTIHDSLGALQDTMAVPEESAQDMADRVSGQLSANAQKAAADISGMANAIDQGIQSVSEGIDRAVEQMNRITDSVDETITQMTEKEQIEDISSPENAERMDGVISGCVNRAGIQGDLNVGGIAGTMNLEYDFDPEVDLDLTGTMNVKLRSSVNDVILRCINYGAVTSKKNCAGGVVGLQELGFVYGSEGYGKIHSDAGSYLGGIAGNSASTVKSCYSLCNIEGMDYTGGICGSGYAVMDSISISSIQSQGECQGSIAGRTQEDGEVSGNRFVSDSLGGIDGINYAGAADQVSYEEIMGMEHIPEGFHTVTVAFQTEDGLLDTRIIPYDGSIARDEIPEVPDKEGCYAQWPEDFALDHITKNTTVTAEYKPWTESVASAEESEDEKPLFLVEGEFYGDTSLNLEEAQGPNKGGTVEYAYTWTLDSQKEKSFDTLKAHFCRTKDTGTTQVWYQKEGDWQKAKTAEDGSYLVADIPYGAAFAVVNQPDAGRNGIYAGIGAAAAAGIGAGLLLGRKKRKAKLR